MPSPCPKCGATKTEPVRHSAAYHVLNLLGYRLRRCSRCRRWRVIEEAVFRRPEAKGSPDDAVKTTSAPGVTGTPRTLKPAGMAFDPDGFSGCPRCGSVHFERTHRNWFERTLRRPRMVRCGSCGKRFPYPQA